MATATHTEIHDDTHLELALHTEPTRPAAPATRRRRRLGRLAGALLGAAVLAGGLAATTMAPAGAMNCATCDPGGGSGGGGTGGTGGTPDNVISYSVRSDLGQGHVITNSGYLDRTTSMLYGTVRTEANWWLFGWHGASLVGIYDKYGTLIWVSPVDGPYGVDGGAPALTVNYNPDPQPVPLSVTQHAAQIEVFNYWDPQWTGLTKVLNGIGGAIGPITQYCTSNPSACLAVATAMFGPLVP